MIEAVRQMLFYRHNEASMLCKPPNEHICICIGCEWQKMINEGWKGAGVYIISTIEPEEAIYVGSSRDVSKRLEDYTMVFNWAKRLGKPLMVTIFEYSYDYNEALRAEQNAIAILQTGGARLLNKIIDKNNEIRILLEGKQIDDPFNNLNNEFNH